MSAARRRGGLGRGLGAFTEAVTGVGVLDVDIDAIGPNPRQPRAALDDEQLGELADSIRQHGVLQPLLVTRAEGNEVAYRLIAGERRWRAARLAGFERVPAVVRPHDDAESLEIALIENMARQDLNPVEEARACALLVDELGLTREEIGRRVGRSRWRPRSE